MTNVTGSPHEPILDDLPSLLSGELSPAREREVADHLDDCDACRRELAVVARASAWLQDAVRLDVLPEAPAADPTDAAAPPAALPPLQLPRHSWSPVRTGRSSHRSALRSPRVLAAAAGVVLLVVAVLGGVVLGRASDGNQGERTVAMAPVPGGLSVPGVAGRAELAADGGMKLDIRGLPTPSNRDFYEIWLFDPPSGRMLSVGVLPASGKGSYSLPASLENSYTAVEISLEPNDGNPEHSKISVLRGPLT